MIHWILLINRQGKVRLSKWYESFTETERSAILRDVQSHVLTRSSKMCNVVDRKDNKIVYKRYASLYFIACIDADENELAMMELLHVFVEVLDSYFGNVCELDLIFHFTRAYWILDEMFSGGELLECDKSAVLAAVYSKDAAAEPVPEFAPKTPSGAHVASASHSSRHR
ncbi:AP-1 complex subunit sigma-1 [Gracilariopsis chorda]|uniref:AP complex subunit sigma n=1 Tax=Gracilariopsis chorda TaxID=448386 RepID=A0A2V3IRQ1_9FLOR|nr:AP-1 complex subunit sigma-1 [Gracilariopsis chorda]|eukprot:PXF44784.1 AP-1 complex subunit sigma-1 [Gracilariopsis chorda]